MGKRELFFALLLIKGLFGSAQTTEWYAHSNCSNRFEVRSLELDELGNIYSLGTYRGKAQFRSASNEGTNLTSHTSDHWEAGFVAKHSNDGELQFVGHFRGYGSNTNYIGLTEVVPLGNGRVAVVLSTQSGFEYKTSKLDSVFRTRVSTSILFLNHEGSVIGHANVPLKHVYDVTESNDSIYILGKSVQNFGRGQSQLYAVSIYDFNSQRINLELHEPSSMLYHNNALWLIDKEATTTGGRYNRYNSDTFRVYTWYPGQARADLVGETYFGPCRSTDAEFITHGNRLSVAIRAVKSNVDLMHEEEKHDVEKGESMYFIFNKKLELQNTLRTTGWALRNGLTGTSDDGYMIQTMTKDSISLNGKHVVEANPYHGSIAERIYVKLDSELQTESVIRGGGGWSNQTVVRPVNRGNTYYFSASLTDYADFDFGRVENTWRTGYYVRKVILP